MESLTMDELIDTYVKKRHGVYVVVFIDGFMLDTEDIESVKELCNDTGIEWHDIMTDDVIFLKFRNKKEAYSFMMKYKDTIYMKMYVNGKYEDENT